MRHALGLAGLLALIAASAGLRIDLALGDPNFDHQSPAPLLKTDPALIYYVTERIVEAGGRPPDDFRADPRIEHPDGLDVPAALTVGQEFLVAWCHLLLAPETPLHVVAVWVMSLCASLVLVGVYGLAWEMTRRVRWALLAALLWTLLLANYRTVGAILIREDFGFPWFALHAWLIFRASRVGSAAAYAAAGLALVAALATWHAIGFVVLMEVACLLLWFLRSGRNLPASGRAWVTLAVVLAGSLAIPVLRAKLFALSLPMLIALAMLAAGRAARRAGWSRASETLAVLLLSAALAVLAAGVARVTGSGLADYSHVYELLFAKMRHLGRLPEDPTQLSFGARLLWTGPFETADAEHFVGGFTAALLALVAGFAAELPDWIAGRGDPRRLLLIAFAGLAVLAALLVQRTELVLGFAAPVVAAATFARLRPPWLGVAVMGLTAAWPAFVLASLDRPVENPWYLPAEHNRELAEMKIWVAENVPPDAPIAADFLTSAAILSHSRHPILQQPKYETRRSRERIERFYQAFFSGSPQDFHRYLSGLGARHLVIERHFLRDQAYVAGVRPESLDARKGTAAYAFLSRDPRVFARVRGFRLLYRSRPELVYDSYRIYQLE